MVPVYTEEWGLERGNAVDSLGMKGRKKNRTISELMCALTAGRKRSKEWVIERVGSMKANIMVGEIRDSAIDGSISAPTLPLPWKRPRAYVR